MKRSFHLSFAKAVASIVTRLYSLSQHVNGQPNINLSEVRSLLCVELTRMGDVISMLPAIQLFRNALPDAEISVAVDRQYETIFRFVRAVDKTFGLENTSKVFGLSSAVNNLRRSQYDLICSMSPSYRNAFVTAVVQAKAKVGYFATFDSLTPFLTPTKIEGYGISPFTPTEFHEENLYQRSLRICQALGVSSKAGRPELTVTEADAKLLRQKLGQHGFSFSTPYVVLHPFAGWEFRYWKFESAVEFIDTAIEGGKKVVLIGDEREREEGERLCSMTKNSTAVARAFGLPLDELVVLLQGSQVFVGTDSGPLHLATALGVPVIGLYGPAHPKFTAPPSAVNSYLFKQVECSPCEQRKCVRPDHPCMHLITSQEVIERMSRVSVNSN